MREYSINGHKLSFYNSIEELPIARFHKYSKYQLIIGGIGDSIEDVDSHLTKIMRLMDSDIAKAKQEVLNMRQNLYFVLNEQDLRHKAYLYLIYSVDDEIWGDFSDEGIEKLYNLINWEREGKMLEVEKELKDKIDNELKAYFPQLFDNATQKNYLATLRKRALLQLSEIIDGVNHSEEIEMETSALMRYAEPKCFNGDGSEEIRFDKQFEDMCLAISKEFGGKVKDFCVMEFYSAYERLEKMQKEMEKQIKKRKK